MKTQKCIDKCFIIYFNNFNTKTKDARRGKRGAVSLCMIWQLGSPQLNSKTIHVRFKRAAGK